MMDTPDPTLIPEALEASRRALNVEATALRTLWDENRDNITDAFKVLTATSGRVVMTGLGKSGHIARKLAATWSSFGTPTYFMHASEALHGDLGMCTSSDVGIPISYSGATAEVVFVANWMRELGMKLIGFSADPNSPLAQLCNVHLSIHVPHEADALRLGPTASTTATLALGDAIGAGIQILTSFTPTDFHFRHPGGALGQHLTEGGNHE